jgi:uncharacterized membrane protein
VKRIDLGSTSFSHSVVAAVTIGAIVAAVAVILDATWTQRATVWYVRVMVVGALQLLVVSVLVTAVLEQRRKRLVRRTLELAFLNRNIRNALVQVQLADHIPDGNLRHQLLAEAIERVSSTLTRITMSRDSTLGTRDFPGGQESEERLD